MQSLGILFLKEMLSETYLIMPVVTGLWRHADKSFDFTQSRSQDGFTSDLTVVCVLFLHPWRQITGEMKSNSPS